MLAYNKKGKNKRPQERESAQEKVQQKLVFQNSGIIDVTNFDAMTPDDPLGYLCGCTIQLFSNGDIIIYSLAEKAILESINLADVFRGSNHNNNYDPESETTVSLMTNEKDIRISFQSIEIKKEFWNAVTTVYSGL